MAEVFPHISFPEKLSELYRNFQQTKKIMDNRKIEKREHNDLEDFLKLSRSYVDFADSLENSMRDTQEFRNRLIDTYEDAVGAINGQIKGTYSGSTLNKGIIFDTHSENSGSFEGVAGLAITMFEKSIGISNSSHTWLKEFLNQYILEMNKSLESIQEDGNNPRLNLSINRVNNAVQDIYSNGNVLSLIYSTKNLLGGLKRLEHSIYEGVKDNKEGISLHDSSKCYIETVEDLKQCALDKEVLEFECTFPNSWHGGSGKHGHVSIRDKHKS